MPCPHYDISIISRRQSAVAAAAYQSGDSLLTVHLGPAAYQMEKRGVPTFAGDLNRDIQRANGILAAIKKTISSLHDWLTSLAEKNRQLESKQEQSGFILFVYK